MAARRVGPTDFSTSGVNVVRLPSRRDPTAAAIIAGWRALTSAGGRGGGRGRGAGGRTLIACSGGVDSSALVLALAAASRDLVVAHIVHDLRPRNEALADRDAARRLAGALGLEFVQTAVKVRGAKGGDGPRNLEAAARAKRYTALERLAKRTGCGFIATAHHADDQLETVLMRLMRGAGPRGLRGVSPRRGGGGENSGGEMQIVRPLLGGGGGVRRKELVDLCRACGWVWREDATNADTRLLRNAVRARVAPVIEELSPGAAARVSAATELFAGAWRVVNLRAVSLVARGERRADGCTVWPRKILKGEEAVVLGEWARVLVGKPLDQRALRPLITAIKDSSTDPRRLMVGRARGVRFEVRAGEVLARCR